MDFKLPAQLSLVVLTYSLAESSAIKIFLQIPEVCFAFLDFILLVQKVAQFT